MKHQKISKCCDQDCSVKLFDYESAVRGYHYYRKYWQLEIQQKLVCSHEKHNPYDFFAINVADITSGMIVGHLPMKNLKVTKFIFDRGVQLHVNFDVGYILQITACLGRLGNTLPH